MFAQQTAFSKLPLALEMFVKGNFFFCVFSVVISEEETKGKKRIVWHVLKCLLQRDKAKMAFSKAKASLRGCYRACSSQASFSSSEMKYGSTFL